MVRHSTGQVCSFSVGSEKVELRVAGTSPGRMLAFSNEHLPRRSWLCLHPSTFNMTSANADRPPPDELEDFHEDQQELLNLDTINWDNIALQQPDQVAAWIRHLHWKEQEAFCARLPRGLRRVFEAAHFRPFPQWTVYNETKLAEVLLDILAEPDMFSREADAYKVRTMMHACVYIHTLSD